MAKHILCPTIRKAYSVLFSYINSIRKRERRRSYGNDNPDKTFYVIGQNDVTGGLWWLINKVLMHLWYSDDNGYIPVVDWQNYVNQYSDLDNPNRPNVWELFFEQPCGYDLTSISNSKNVILNKEDTCPNPYYLMGNFYEDEARIQKFQSLFKQYIRFNDKTYKYLSDKWNAISDYGNRRIVGVLCRGTDYVRNKPKNHPVQPNPEQVVSDVYKCMNQFRCDYVFIATEDIDIFNMFLKEFKEKLLYIDQNRFRLGDNDEWLSDAILRDTNDPSSSYQRGVDYLMATFILSKCTCYIGGRTGGSKGVLILSEGFEYKNIYNLGLY